MNAGFIACGYSDDCLTGLHETGPKITAVKKNQKQTNKQTKKKGTKQSKSYFIVHFSNWWELREIKKHHTVLR